MRISDWSSDVCSSDLYYASDLGGPTDDSDETTGRLFPQIGVKWQYPWERRASTYSHVIEPIVGIVGGPNGSNPDEIPNEDSRSFEFDTDRKSTRLNSSH